MLKALRGTKDILPADAAVWQYIESSARDIFSIYNYKEIRTPIIEEASLFKRSIGDTTDIVEKQMYVFTDRGGRNIALRPEATASIVRAYLENSIGEKESLTKLFYIGAMFRSERPQKGRQRQFHQIGVEAIGSDNPLIDVEVIAVALALLEKLGITDFNLCLNSLGCKKDKIKIIDAYKNKIKPYLNGLCEECNARYSKNVLRIFDCKNPDCRKAVSRIELKDPFCPDCKTHFESVKKGLGKLNIDYLLDSKIVRGLDYYTKTVFEITQGDLGSKDAICAGGRYNNLIEDMGGKDTPAVGFAFGIERMTLAIPDAASASKFSLDVFIALTGDTLFEDAFLMMSKLRNKNFSCDMDYTGKSLKAQMRKAEKLGAMYVIIFGEEEFGKGRVVLRDMENRVQNEVELDAADTYLRRVNC